VQLPARKLSNNDVKGIIRDRYRGDPRTWEKVERAVDFVFSRCNSELRYIEPDEKVRVADFAAQAGRRCLSENGVDPEEIDLLIHASVAREYFEPATAMEVAARVGARETLHAFDVTSACTGQLEAIHIATAYFSLYPEMQTAMVVSGELTRRFLGYEVQSLAEVELKAAGLTIGNAASAWLIRRRPFEGGCLRPLHIANTSIPKHWHLSSAPIDGTFVANSRDLFKLHVHIPGEIKRVLGLMGWRPEDIDHFVFHQPSDLMVQKVLEGLEVDPERGIKIHNLYGNTASTTVSLTLNELVQRQALEAGHRLLLHTAAAGFSMVTIAGEWVA
jgi:3-oxoacyl-[acyl-carrier-protein] synthase-3